VVDSLIRRAVIIVAMIVGAPVIWGMMLILSWGAFATIRQIR
jgi:hypothetical protein